MSDGGIVTPGAATERDAVPRDAAPRDAVPSDAVPSDADRAVDPVWDVVVIGAGPAGLSAALNLARARRRTLVLDSNRPRNAVTLASHGFLSRDGVSPMELRSLGRDELAAYPETEFRRTLVTAITRDGDTFVVTDTTGSHRTTTVLLATGVAETLPKLPSLRSFYGTSIHSCIACDAYEYSDRPIALLGETNDLVDRALVLSQWSRDLIVFTNGIAVISAADEARLAEGNIRVDRRVVVDVAGDRIGLTGVLLADGDIIARDAIFVRPVFSAALGYADALGLAFDADGFLVVDADGRTIVHGVYAAGESTPPGPEQLVVAAGAGARTASAINHDLALQRPA